MNTQKISVVAAILFLIGLSFLSGHLFDIAILLGSLYLLQIQAIGTGYRHDWIALEAVVVWKIGLESYYLTCPSNLFLLILLVANITVFLFAPVRIVKRKNAADEVIQTIQQYKAKKNKAVFVCGILSIFAILLYGKPVSSCLLIALLVETELILSMVLGDLLQERFQRF